MTQRDVSSDDGFLRGGSGNFRRKQPIQYAIREVVSHVPCTFVHILRINDESVISPTALAQQIITARTTIRAIDVASRLLSLLASHVTMPVCLIAH